MTLELVGAPEIIATPTWASDTGDDVDISAAIIGAKMLGLPLFDQGRAVARLMEARNDTGGVQFREVVIQLPRRSTKTTSIWATLIGRAQTRKKYRAVVTAQTGTIASRILLEHAEALITQGHAVESREKGSSPRARRPVQTDLWGTDPDTATRETVARAPILVYRSGGREYLRWANGNTISAVPPEAGAVRSAAADDIVIDESGEFDIKKGDDFLTAVLPLMDTRGPLAQLVVTGTPGKARAGFFWIRLEEARGGTSSRKLGILDYSIRDDEDASDRRVWRRVHPGPTCGLTPMDVLEDRWAAFQNSGGGGAAKFAREYLCRWPVDATVGAIDATKWAMATAAIELPEQYAIAMDVEVDDSAAAICAAWRDQDGIAHITVLEHRHGVDWIAPLLAAKSKKMTRLTVAYDSIGANHGPATALTRAKVQIVAMKSRDTQAAAQTLVGALGRGHLRHGGQESLDAAVKSATWRESESGRYFGRRGGTVSPLVAAAAALWQWDAGAARRDQRMTIVTAS